MDAYIPWMYSLVLGLLEVSGLVYLYGTKNITKHFHVMIRKKTLVFPVIWKFILSPVLLVSAVESPGRQDYDQLTKQNSLEFCRNTRKSTFFPVK